MTDLQMALSGFLHERVGLKDEQPTLTSIADHFKTTESYASTMLDHLREDGVVTLSEDGTTVIKYHEPDDWADNVQKKLADPDPMIRIEGLLTSMDRNVESHARAARYNADTLEQILHVLLHMLEPIDDQDDHDPEPVRKKPSLRIVN